MKLEEELQPAAYEEFVPGRRSRRRRAIRRRRSALSLMLALALTATAVWAGVTLLAGGKGATKHRSGLIGSDAQTAWLFMIRRADDLSRRSDMLAVFAIDAHGGNPVTLLIPTTALTEIPGHGVDLAGRGFSFGTMPLQSLVVDNMLGIGLDHDLAMTDEVLGKLVDQVGGIDVEVSGPLVDDSSHVGVPVFDSGLQHFDGANVRKFVLFQGSDETELSRLARAQQVWEGLIVAWGKLGTGVLAQRFRAIGNEYGQGLETGIPPLELAEFFTAFAAAGSENRVYTTLPVTPVSAGNEQAMRIDDDKVADISREYFSGSLPANPFRGTRIEVLNANGVPQVGLAVALKLVPKGFTLVVDRNARTFDVETTRIVVYSRDDRAMGAARKIRDLLGVGEIQIGPQTQSLVDVTVVVGHDFGAPPNG